MSKTKKILLFSSFVLMLYGLAVISTVKGAYPDGSGPYGGVYRYTTNAIPNTGTMYFGRSAYYTNITASYVVPAFGNVSVSGYETIVLLNTNSTAGDLTVTMPAGVPGPVGSGTPAVFTCTAKTVTYIYISHYGQMNTNAWSQTFGQ